MNESALAEAIKLAQEHPVFVATASLSGTPHLACAGTLNQTEEGDLEVTEWFCPSTVENLAENRRVSLTVWDKEADRGYQIIGKVQRVEELGVLDGFSPEEEAAGPVPQERRGFVVRVEKILDFSLAPHTDLEK